ncbi:MAG: isovaleryl-CoA dehydrogenase [Burkholderiaceae bacterium]
MPSTHEVTNQALPLSGHNLFAGNHGLRDALMFNAPGLDTAALHALGEQLGRPEMQEHAKLANQHKPQLHSHDRFGRRIDEVEFHPSYHALMGAATAAGLHGTPWAGGAQAHLQRAAAFMLFTELEPSVLCPISMTYAVTPALRANAAIHAQWLPKLASTAYDPRLVPFDQKAGVTMGMGMTEKQGGSDVRSNTTQARFEEQTPWGARYALLGHKWFLSAPMCDAFLVLAQSSAGLSCFFLPRMLADGSSEGRRNRVFIQRLKDKLGNQANASSEVEFDDAHAWLVGEEGRGVPQILEMGTRTRLDCALGTSGLMRQALSLALHHTAQRKAFGRRLIEQPLMRNVLADLALESEAATALSLRLARAFANDTDHELQMRRLLTPVAKFWVCKRGSHFAQEAMECLGGNGYVEEGGAGVMARIYREMPVNSIWEGAGNIMTLDLLRCLRKLDKQGGTDGDCVAALRIELAPARRAHAALDAYAARLFERIDESRDEIEARRLAQDIALLMQAALLCQHAPSFVFDAFCRSRLGSDSGRAFGTLPAGLAFDDLIARAMPG